MTFNLEPRITAPARTVILSDPHTTLNLQNIPRASHVFGHENIIPSLLRCRNSRFEGVQCRGY
jgi:hypothetical protein